MGDAVEQGERVRSREEAADRAEIDAVVATFFAAFTSGPDLDARLDALRAVLLPQALVVRTCGGEPLAYDVEAFLAPRRALLSGTSARTVVSAKCSPFLSMCSSVVPSAYCTVIFIAGLPRA